MKSVLLHRAFIDLPKRRQVALEEDGLRLALPRLDLSYAGWAAERYHLPLPSVMFRAVALDPILAGHQSHRKERALLMAARDFFRAIVYFPGMDTEVAQQAAAHEAAFEILLQDEAIEAARNAKSVASTN